MTSTHETHVAPRPEEAAPLSTQPSDPRAIASRVRRDHATIRTLLDDVDRAGTAALERRTRSLDELLRSVWELYLFFEDHLAMEEALVAPILRARVPSGEKRAVAMILEHNEQRRLIRELVDDTECDTKDIATLVAQAVGLVSAFRADMIAEDASLAVLGQV